MDACPLSSGSGGRYPAAALSAGTQQQPAALVAGDSVVPQCQAPDAMVLRMLGDSDFRTWDTEVIS